MTRTNCPFVNLIAEKYSQVLKVSSMRVPYSIARTKFPYFVCQQSSDTNSRAVKINSNFLTREIKKVSVSSILIIFSEFKSS